jgi:hypothetical protein
MRLDIKRIELAVGKIDAVFLNSPQYVCEGLSLVLRPMRAHGDVQPAVGSRNLFRFFLGIRQS